MASPSTQVPFPFPGPRILIVDDDRINLSILGTILKPEGYDLAEAGSGEAALARYPEFQPHLVLLDVVMPGIDGLETCRQLKRLYGEKAAPVIFVTAKTDSDDVVEGLGAGAVDYLSKPFKPKEVVARIRAHLQNQILAEQRRSLVEQLSQANAAKNRVLGMVAHDLRNPLASIRGIAEFLRDGAVGPLSAEQVDLVQTIHGASQAMLEMVNELLDVATIEAGELKLHAARHDFTELAAKCVAMNNMEAAKKKTQIVFLPPAEPVKLTADGAKMKQLLDNLLSNAVKYSPPGSIVDAILEVDAAGGTCSFSVRDQGPGIPDHERHRLFKDFGRLSSLPTAGEKSTGLGLAICRKIVEAHGGTIVAENLAVGGCEFKVTLPLSV